MEAVKYNYFKLQCKNILKLLHHYEIIQFTIDRSQQLVNKVSWHRVTSHGNASYIIVNRKKNIMYTSKINLFYKASLYNLFIICQHKDYLLLFII